MITDEISTPAERVRFAAFTSVVGAGLGLVAAWSISLGLAAAAFLSAYVAVARSHRKRLLLAATLIVFIAFSSAMERGRLLPYLKPNEMVLLTATLATLMYSFVRRPNGRVPAGLLVPALLMLLTSSILPFLAYSMRGTQMSTLTSLKLLSSMQYLPLAWVFFLLVRTAAERRVVIYVMIACSAMVAIVGILQATGIGVVDAFLRTWYPSNQLQASQHAGRVTSVLGAWNVLGLYMVFNLLLIAAVAPHTNARRTRLGLGMASIALLLCLVMTNLYSGFLGLIVGYVVVKAFYSRGWRTEISIALAGAVGVAFWLPEIVRRLALQFTGPTGLVPQTLVFRWGVWKNQFIPKLLAHPIWGVSPTFAGLKWPYPESEYIFLWYRAGGIALVAHVLAVVAILVWLWRQIQRRAPDFERSLFTVLFAALVVLSLVGLINPVFTYAGTVDYIWILFGIAAGIVGGNATNAT